MKRESKQNFYDKRVEALQLIDSLHNDGVPYNRIVYKVSTKFGFSERMVRKRIELIESMKEE